MALYRPTYTDRKTKTRVEARVWWFEFIYDGKRIRQSAKTTRKTIALEAEKNYRKRLERAGNGLPSESAKTRIRTVAAALDTYRKTYGVGTRPKSVLVVDNRSAHVKRVLGSLLLPDLTRERIVGYMAQRRKEGAGNRTINIELGVLSRANRVRMACPVAEGRQVGRKQRCRLRSRTG